MHACQIENFHPCGFAIERMFPMQWQSALAFVCIVFLCVHSTNALSFHRLGYLQYSEETSVASEESSSHDVLEKHFIQKLDHFRPTDDAVFKQRYFTSRKYIRENAELEVAFLCVGGEGPALDKTVLINSVHCSGDMLFTADILFHDDPKLSIHLYALEHRYYGDSYPSFQDGSSPVTNENLVFLNSRQALADIAHFVKNTNPGIRWITFGGSYPGMLSAWARLKYPHLVYAAVSNSAPIQAVLEFSAYNNHVAEDFKNPDVGGSDECLDTLRQGHVEIAEALSDRSRHSEVANLFGLCNHEQLWVEKNVALFIGDGVIDLGTQENDPACDKEICNIEKKCNALLSARADADSAMLALAALSKKQRPECLDIDWNTTLSDFADPIRGKRGGLRSWIWQTCTEFGFYQTCPINSSCPFARGYHNLSQDLEVCDVAFNISSAQVVRSVLDSNEYYGGWQLQTSRVFSVNGETDPWSELALTSSHSCSLPVFNVKGASHHFWTHKPRISDSASVIEARSRINFMVRQWLGYHNNTMIVTK